MKADGSGGSGFVDKGIEEGPERCLIGVHTRGAKMLKKTS
jgi:hypothetical protein